MRICLLTTQIPFIHGGAEFLTLALLEQLTQRKIEAEIITVPFRSSPPKGLQSCMEYCDQLDVSEWCGRKIDRVIGLKFPTYYAQHDNKVLWILHQHRAAYDLWESDVEDLWRMPEGPKLRQQIEQLDRKAVQSSKQVYTISERVTKRLRHYNDLNSQVLYPPPSNWESFGPGPFEDYLFFPSRIGALKRQSMVLQALAKCSAKVRVVFSGNPDDPAYLVELKKIATTLGLDQQVQWTGFVSHAEKMKLYSNCRGVLFIPKDEDLGYIAMEAMLSEKPVLTTNDSGGPLEFISDGINGRIVNPDVDSLATGMEELWNSPALQRQWGIEGARIYKQKNITWDAVIERLLHQ